jgi:hypothetical protein
MEATSVFRWLGNLALQRTNKRELDVARRSTKLTWDPLLDMVVAVAPPTSSCGQMAGSMLRWAIGSKAVANPVQTHQRKEKHVVSFTRSRKWQLGAVSCCDLVEDHRGCPSGDRQVEPERDGESSFLDGLGRTRVQVDTYVAIAMTPAVFRFWCRLNPHGGKWGICLSRRPSFDMVWMLEGTGRARFYTLGWVRAQRIARWGILAGWLERSRDILAKIFGVLYSCRCEEWDEPEHEAMAAHAREWGRGWRGGTHGSTTREARRAVLVKWAGRIVLGPNVVIPFSFFLFLVSNFFFIYNLKFKSELKSKNSNLMHTQNPSMVQNYILLIIIFKLTL